MATRTSTLLMSRIGLGRALRRLRDDNDMTIAEVAAKLRCDESLISRIETGKRPCSHIHFSRLMTLYEAPEPEREKLAQLHAETRERRQPWWSQYSDIISANYERFLAFEDAAERVLEFQFGLLPGLLQTEGYARAVTGVGFDSLGPDQVDGLVEVRMVRQRKRLHDTTRPLVCMYVVTQAALEFQVGGREVHRQQLGHLLELSDHERVAIQVIPYEKGEEGCQIGGFMIFEFPGDMPEVAFGESVAGNAVLDDPRDLRRMRRLHRGLTAVALSESDTKSLIMRTRDRRN
ncbi:helix-turn-helix transcriptional regulator [Streptomyces sp. ACA25]|uniref:helix-turn-helix domain-containing protein n=1 Tax=Streptomyces sp. ACA25 TaxID=3022596 RepID=UPI002307ACEA|nr:helix-turn-helix transcriptional regulator [Streptomyces sp. ACA25]MDB1087694.1 helix-turn-helix transcriptional regulator [Streptomyces sp. ACA25]